MSAAWPRKELGACVKSDPDYGANAPAVPYDPCLPRYVRITDIGADGRLVNHDPVSITRDAADGAMLESGDIVFARSGATVGKTYVHDHANGECAFAGYLIRFRTDPRKLLSRFLSQYARTNSYWRWVALTARAGAQPNISAREYARLPVPCPPVDQQQEIIASLEAWEAADAVLQRLVDAKRRFKRGLMQQLLKGKRRFKDFQGEPWQEWRLGDLFSERVETGRPDLPLLSITGDRGVIPRDELERRDISNTDKSKYLRIAQGDIGYNTMRMWQGVSALSTFEGIVSPAYTICVPGPAIHGPFAAHLFKLPSVVHLFHRYSQGLVKDTLNLKFPRFAKVRVTVPGIEEQRVIAEALSAIDREVVLLERLRDALDRQRRGVAELLLTGQVPVPA